MSSIRNIFKHPVAEIGPTHGTETFRNSLTIANIVVFGIIAFQLCVVGLMCAIGYYERPSPDDLLFTRKVADLGSVRMVGFLYIHSYGRYSWLILMSILYKLFPAQAWYIPTLLVVVWLSGLVVLLKRWLRTLGAFLISATVILTTLFLTPDLTTSFYWAASSLNNLPPITLGAWGCVSLICITEREKRAKAYYRFLSFLIGLFISGFSEVGMVTYAFLSVGFCALSHLLRWNIRTISSYFATGCIAGGIIMVKSPGSYSRASGFVHPSIVSGLEKSFSHAVVFFQQGMLPNWTSGLGYCNVSDATALLIFVFAASAFAPWKLKLSIETRFAVGAFLAALVCFVVAWLTMFFGVMAINGQLPERTQIIDAYFNVVAVAFLGYGIGSILPSDVKATRFIGFMFVAFCLLVRPIPFMQPLVCALSSLGSVNMYADYASFWDANNEILLTAESQGKREAEIKVPAPDIYQEGHANTVNAAEYYYHIPNIIYDFPPR